MEQPQSLSTPILYQYCPVEQLAQLVNKPVSIKARVIDNTNSALLTVALDNREIKTFNIAVNQHNFIFMFRSQQLRELSKSNDFRQVQEYIYNEEGKKSSVKKNSEYEYVPNQNGNEPKNDEQNDEHEKSTEPPKVISVEYFKPGFTYEFRGILVRTDMLQMHEFTSLGNAFNLDDHNQLLSMLNKVRPDITYP